MKSQKILNLWNETSNSRFMKRKWNMTNDQSNTNYDVGKKFVYNTHVLKSNLGNYNNAYILVRG